MGRRPLRGLTGWGLFGYFSCIMSASHNQDGQSGPGPQNELDRLIHRADKDAGVLGQVLRVLWGWELFTVVPGHPELVGEHERDVADGFTWCVWGDEEGGFAAVFTSEVAARAGLRRVWKGEGVKPMIVQMPAEVMFHFFNNGRTTVRVLAGGGVRLVLEPSAVAGFVSGELSRNKVQEGPSELAESVKLRPVPEERVPFMLLRAMRVFCVQRKSAVGLYVFHQEDEATGSFPENDLRVVLWMRSPDHAFYNDFCMMAERMMPPRLDFYCAAVTAEDADTVAFLQQHRPLWPITKK